MARWNGPRERLAQGWLRGVGALSGAAGAAYRALLLAMPETGSLPLADAVCAVAGAARPSGGQRAAAEAALGEMERAGLVDLGLEELVVVPHADLYAAASWAASSYVYFVRAGPSGPVKIGCTDSVPRRLAQLQTAQPEPLVLLAAVPGDLRLEAHLHARFAADRIRGEWFRPTPALLALAAALGCPS